jgi:diaminopimelate epimerase
VVVSSGLTPGGINVEFVRIVARDKIEMRVWERGVGETMACGTGMVAAAAAAHDLDLTDSNVTVRVPGGEGSVELEQNTSWLTGPANYVFAGEVGGSADQSDRMTLTTFPMTSTPES